MPSLVQRAFPGPRRPRSISATPSGPTSKEAEPKKVIVSTSLRTALRRCWLHFFPIATSIAIIVVNIKGVYIGEDFTGLVKSQTLNLMFLQLAAKAHELFIVASLGLIVLQTVRHELLFGDGLPLGLIGSGISFSSAAFFFKQEFYGAIKYVAKQSNKARKVAFIALLLLAGIIGTLAGPASAVLLVSQNEKWASGGTDIYLNGAEASFWPSDLTGGMSEIQPFCGNATSTAIAICPAGGFDSLYEHWTRLNYTNFDQQNVRLYAKNISGTSFYWPTHSPRSLLPPLYSMGNIRDGQGDTFLVQPHAAAAAILQQAATDWWKALTSPHRVKASLIDDRQVVAHAKSPIVSTRCAGPKALSASDKSVSLPTVKGRFDFGEPADFAFESIVSAPSDHLQFDWVQLPADYGAASTGAIFQSPWTAGNASRLVLGCTIQAGWVPTNVQTDSYTFWSGWYPWNVSFGERTPAWIKGSPSPTNGRIALGDAWLKMLTPKVPQIGPGAEVWQPSTIESILAAAEITATNPATKASSAVKEWIESDVGGRGKTAYIESVISSLLVDGLSRTGSHLVFDTNSSSSHWPLSWYAPLPDFEQQILGGRTAFKAPEASASDIVILHMRMTITGFALQQSLSGYLAMGVLSIHMMMATAHVIWVICNKRTSSSFSSVSELIAVAQNSKPAHDTLANTSSGIDRSATFSHLARIRVCSQPGRLQSDHVELIFEKMDGHARSQTTSTSPVSGPQVVPCAPDAGSSVSRAERWQTPSSTWTRDTSRLHVTHGTELHSRSSSTERLMPRVYLADEEKGDIVVVNRAYA